MNLLLLITNMLYTISRMFRKKFRNSFKIYFEARPILYEAMVINKTEEFFTKVPLIKKKKSICLKFQKELS